MPKVYKKSKYGEEEDTHKETLKVLDGIRDILKDIQKDNLK